MFKKLIFLIILISISACGGGGTSQLSGAVVLDEGIEYKRPFKPNQGIRWRLLQDGSRLIWIDPELAIAESTTYVTGTGIINQNSEVAVYEGNFSGLKSIQAVSSVPVQNQPIGSVSYQGEGIIRVTFNETGAPTKTFQKFASANMNINFTTDNGMLYVTSVDNKSNAQIDVNVLSSSWLSGSGTFTSQGETWCIGICRDRFNYDDISEASTFVGTLTGSNGEGAMGTLMGNRHEIGITLE